MSYSSHQPIGPQPCPVIYVVANPVRCHKEVPRSTGHIMVTTPYSDQQGSESPQKVMRLCKQWHRPISKRLIKPPYSISRAASIYSECCRLPTTSVLSNKADKLRSNQFSSTSIRSCRLAYVDAILKMNIAKNPNEPREQSTRSRPQDRFHSPFQIKQQRTQAP